MLSRRVVILSGAGFLVASVAFGIYLRGLSGQLEQAFQNEEQYLPTRIYSDVVRIAPPQSRAYVEDRLKILGYTPKSEPTELSFQVHRIDYPIYLIPEGHPIADAAAKGTPPVALEFDGEGEDSLLQSIKLGGDPTGVASVEIPDLYLEPELVATLGHGSTKIRELVKFEDIPANLWKAIIAIEDQHFLEHRGVDPRGFARAIWVNIRTHSLAQGGSTITQQLVKNLMARHSKNVFRKFSELFLALILEHKMDKEQILERYLNEVYLGQIGSLEIHGVAEGARHFFGKRLDELSLGEMALLAGQIRSPVVYSPYRYRDRAIERQHLVLRKMVETGMIAQEEMDAAVKFPLRFQPPQTATNKAPYFVDFVKAELIRQLKDKMSETELSEAGFRIYTTLDMPLYSIAQQSVSNGIQNLEKKMGVKAPERLEGALASVDQSTGYIRALIGGRSYSQSTFNRILNMKRQVGSTFKPFVYLAAILRGEDPNGITYGPGYPSEDAPWTLEFDHGNQSWSPKNYEKDYLGWITLRKALAHSINTVTARLGVQVGIDNVVLTAKNLGVDSYLPPVPSLSLGVAELSPVELLRAYATIANHGVQEELTAIRAIVVSERDEPKTEIDRRYGNVNLTTVAHFVFNPKQVLDTAAADLMADMLQSVFSEGTAREAYKMGFDHPAAGKTGTTSHHRDSWFAGFTPQLTTVVWVGMDQAPASLPGASPSPGKMDDDDEDEPRTRIALTGATSALPIWADYMEKALDRETPATFTLSPYLVDVQIDLHSGKQAAPNCPASQVIVDKYIRGHEPRAIGCEVEFPASPSKTEM